LQRDATHHRAPRNPPPVLAERVGQPEQGQKAQQADKLRRTGRVQAAARWLKGK
jgi:hypothetical protein